MVPPAVHSPNPQVTLQFLSSILSQRGPSAVPYSEDTKWLIRNHLVSLTTEFPSLEPKTATFTHNDGRSVNLLKADGTIPMTFQNVTYNIPVVIWLMETYPRHPPVVYVNPTRDMIIKRPHNHVNPSGLVSVPYLHDWVYPSSNLVDLVVSLGLIFGSDPPLYSQRRPNPNSNPNPNPNPNPNISNLNPSSSFSNSSSSGYQLQRPQQQQQQQQQHQHQNLHPPRTYPASPYSPSRPIHTEDASEVFRRNAINKLVEMVHGDVMSLRKKREAEMEGLFGLQGVLKQREEYLNKGVREMQEEMEALEQQLQMVLLKPLLLFSTISTYLNYSTFLNATQSHKHKHKHTYLFCLFSFHPSLSLSLSLYNSFQSTNNMTRPIRILQDTAAPPSSAASVESDFVIILAALLCALISVVGLTAIARCAWLRRGQVAGNSPTRPVPNRGLKKKVLNSLPKFNYLDGTPGKWVATSECSICLSEFAAGDEVRLLPQCGHGFHVACIDTWLGSHSSCPSCRAPFAVARCQKCGLYQPTPAAGDSSGETESKSVGVDNANVSVDVNCVGNAADRHSSHSVYNGFLP